MAKTIPFVQRILAEGNALERKAEKKEITDKAIELVRKMPTEQTARRIYLINLVQDMSSGKVSMEVFIKFCEMTNCVDEIHSIYLRLKGSLNKKGVRAEK